MKGITPIIATIILLLITVSLAAAAWGYMQIYFLGITAKNLQVVDTWCGGDGRTATVLLRNYGTTNITTSSCSLGGDVRTCGEVRVTRTSGKDAFAPSFDKIEIGPGDLTIFSDSGCATPSSAASCEYRFIPEGSGKVSTAIVPCF